MTQAQFLCWPGAHNSAVLEDGSGRVHLVRGDNEWELTNGS